MIGHYGMVRCVNFSLDGMIFSLDGKKIASGGDEGSVVVCDMKSGKEIGIPMIGHEKGVNCVSSSGDEKRVVSGGDDGSVFVWDVATGDMIRKVKIGDGDELTCVRFSKDGKRVLSVGGLRNESVVVWDLEIGNNFRKLMIGDEGMVKYVSFSVDGKSVVYGGDDGNVVKWDVESGKMIANPMIGDEYEVTCVSFCVDGNRVISGDAVRGMDWSVREGNVNMNLQIAENFVSWRMGKYQLFIKEILQHVSLHNNNSSESDLVCMQTIHKEIVDTVQKMGWSTNGLILDECSDSTCCVEDVTAVGTSTNKYELLASEEGVEVKIGENRVRLATVEGCSSSASHNLAVAHGFRDGKVVISYLQE